jgi:omega-6 fatty acid desaturase (delta-12 desaturase)
MFSTLPYKYRARAHHFHHAHSGKLEVRDIGDIPMLTVEEYKQKPRYGRRAYSVFRSPIVLFFFAPVVYFVALNRFPNLHFKGMTSKIKRDQVKNNLLLLGLYVSLALLIGRKPFVLIQGSIVLMFSIIAFWFFYVQHQHEEAYKEWSKNWDFLSSAIIGSTYYKLPKLFQWFTGNIGIHHIHHLCSAIPNYNLQKCIDHNQGMNKYVTTINFRQSLGIMFNKLRDEQQKKMI